MRYILLTAILAAPFLGSTQTGIPARPAALAYDHIREADVFWKKRVWRIIDARSKQNLPFVYPKEPFVSVLIRGVQEGLITAYDPSDGDDFGATLSAVDLIRMLYRIDSITIPNPYYPERDTTIAVPRPFDPLTVTKFKIKEEWIFDKERSEMVVRIIAIAPVRDVLDPRTGELRGESVMFWIDYSEARNLLAAHFAFNPNNDFTRHTWENIFEMRFFDSYIVKEENEYDRLIQEYASGVDAVLESERIKTEIFRLEHELWHY
jgi:gliding motility associated protien GldN